MIKLENLAIVITSLGNKHNLNLCLKSIFRQTSIPKEIIVALPQGKFFQSNNKHVKIVYSKVKNQVAQRNEGLDKLSKKIQIIIQLDDRVILNNNAIQKLHNCWKKNITSAGIGFNNILSQKKRFVLNEDTSILNFILTKLKTIIKPGSVLPNGICIPYDNVCKLCNVQWLRGGLSSYNLKKVKKFIFNRSFPEISWSVCEDLIFSYKLSKKNKLLVCPEAKVRILKKKLKSNNIFDQFNMGMHYSQNLKYFVKKNFELSFISFVLTTVLIFIFGIFKGIITFNLNIFSRSIGRLIGLFKKPLIKN